MSEADDVFGRWFAARNTLGIDSAIHLRLVDSEGRVIAAHELPHAEFDGVGGLCHLLDQWGATYNPPPNSRKQPKPSLQDLIRTKAWTRSHRLVPKWRQFSPLPKPIAVGDFRFELLSKEDTAGLYAEARRRGVTLLSLVFWAQHTAAMDVLNESDAMGGCWLVPANLRGQLDLPRATQNHASALFIDLARADTPEIIHQKLRQRMLQGQHWWSWFVAYNIARLGQRFVNRVFPLLQKPGNKMGSFSTVGSWKINWEGAGFPSDTFVVMCGPGSPSFPISNAMIEINDRLALSLRVDSYLNVSTQCRDHLMAVYLSNLRSLMATSTLPTASAC